MPRFIAADLVAQAEHDPDALAIFITTSRELAQSVSSQSADRARNNTIARESLQRPVRFLLARIPRAGARLGEPTRSRTHHGRSANDLPFIRQCRFHLRRRLLAASRRRLRLRPQPRPAHRRTGALSRRPQCAGLCEDHHRPGTFPRRPAAASRTPSNVSPTAEGLAAHAESIRVRCKPMLSPREAVRTLPSYHPPLGGREGLRLDFNENTVGCSPRVLERSATDSSLEDLARYPEREPVEAAVAEFLGVYARRTSAHQRRRRGHPPGLRNLSRTRRRSTHRRAHVFDVPDLHRWPPEPKSSACQPVRTFTFPTERIYAITSQHRTRLIAIANPNNPTGTLASPDDLLQIAHVRAQRRHPGRRSLLRILRTDCPAPLARIPQPLRRAHVFESLRPRRTPHRRS